MTELPPEWLYFHNAELIVGTLALIVNFTLMYFIICKTPKELKEYRPYVFVITVIIIFA